MHGIKRTLFLLLLTLGPLASAQTPGEDLMDTRDGKSYPTVWIGEQHWLARNMDLETPGRQYYSNDQALGGILGGLYTWEEATAVCAEGWHLPSRQEWEALSDFLGKEEAGQQLKAQKGHPLHGWDGNNASGFSALPAGCGNGDSFKRKNDWAVFWALDEASETRAWFAQLDGFWYAFPPKYKSLYIGSYYLKSNLFSVRCLEDVPEKTSE